MSAQKSQIEILSAQNARLQDQIDKLEKEAQQREYRQGLKERTLWVGMPNVWFAVVEAEFKTAGIIDDYTKYNYVLSQLPQDVSDKVKDIIDNPPIRGKYMRIKEELLRRISKPEFEKFRELFDAELGDKTPSQLYRHMVSLAGTNVTVEKIMLHLWMRRLPKCCQEILASRLEQSNLKLAELADSILEVTKLSNSDLTKSNLSMNHIQQSVDDLSKQVAALEVSVRGQASRSRSRSTSKPRSVNTTPARTTKTCWYHMTYGPTAYRCVSPCSWTKPESEGEKSS